MLADTAAAGPPPPHRGHGRHELGAGGGGHPVGGLGAGGQLDQSEVSTGVT